MSEQATGSSIFANLEAITNQEQTTDRTRSAAHLSLKQWLLMRRRTAAGIATGLVGLTAVACGQQVASAPHPPLPPNSVAPKPVSNLLYPCRLGGSMGIKSKDTVVRDYMGLTTQHAAALFDTGANNVQQCNGPVEFENDPAMITTAEFQKVTSGDRVVIYITTVPESTAPDLPATSWNTHELVQQNDVTHHPTYFSDSYADEHGQRDYNGAVMSITDPADPNKIVGYQGLVDRRKSPGSSELYEMGMAVFNGPDNNAVATVPMSNIQQQLGEWMDRAVTAPAN